MNICLKNNHVNSLNYEHNTNTTNVIQPLNLFFYLNDPMEN
jgi:hypothetical protein